MNEFQKKVEQFRTHYFIKYGQKLDDEILYFFIRVNEMQVDLRKQMQQLSKDIKSERIAFKNGKDYFLYGFGRISGFICITALFIITILLVRKI